MDVRDWKKKETAWLTETSRESEDETTYLHLPPTLRAVAGHLNMSACFGDSDTLSPYVGGCKAARFSPAAA